MKIDCIAVDDEPLALDIIREYSLKLPYLNLLATYDNGVQSLQYLKKQKIDLLFLDIQMEELTGIQLLNIIKDKPLVIFTTAYDHYAIQGFDLDAVDYLLKPISFERFVKAVDKAYDRLKSKTENSTIIKEKATSNGVPDYIFVKSEFHLERVKVTDILFIEGQGDYLMIHTPSKKIMTLQSFRKAEEILPSDRFCRVHKSYMVALDRIESIERNRIKIGGELIPVSESHRKIFYDLIEKRGLV